MAKLMRYGIAAALLVVLLVPATNAAVNKGDIIVGPSVQVGLPMGDFGDIAGFGFGIGAVGDFLVTNDIAIGGDLVYNFFKSEFESDVEGVDIDAPKVLQFGAHAKKYFSPDAETNPFVFAGLAIYNVKQSVSFDVGPFGSGSVSGSSSEFGFNGGAGAQFAAGEKMRLAAQGHIHIIMSDPSLMYVGGALTLLFGVGGSN